MARLLSLLFLPVLASVSAVAAQTNCNGYQPSAPAFAVDCPCGAGNYPYIAFTGTGRIGSTQLLTFTGFNSQNGFQPIIAFLLVGTASSQPYGVPSGLVSCATTMQSVTSLSIDPLIFDVVPCLPNQSSGYFSIMPYYLFIPNVPAAVGITVNLQYFEQMAFGGGNIPFAPSAVIGFTVAQ
jgi:hypothetical protein